MILLEFATDYDAVETARQLDQMILFINRKYRTMNMTLPSLLILEYFPLFSYYEAFLQPHDPTCDDILLDTNPNITRLFPPHGVMSMDTAGEGLDGSYPGSHHSMYLFTIARYFRIPMISIVDALWPSFVRYYSTHPTCSLWPYMTSQGERLSEIAIQLIVQEIVQPFFRQVLSQQSAESLHSMKSHGQEIQSKTQLTDLFHLLRGFD
jgi:hypothetical protein